MKRVLAMLVAVVITAAAVPFAAVALDLPPPSFTRQLTVSECEMCGVTKTWRVTTMTVVTSDETTVTTRTAAKYPCANSHRLTTQVTAFVTVCELCGLPECDGTCEVLPPVGTAITLDAHGGTVTPTVVYTNADGVLAGVLPIPTREGYLFRGWRLNTDGNLSFSLDNTGKARSGNVFTEPVTFYAAWDEAGERNIYTATLDANGGEFYAGAPTSVTTGALERLISQSTPTPTRVGHYFDGWYTEREGGTRVTTSTTLSSDTNLYARWSPIKIAWNANGGAQTDIPASELNADGTLAELAAVSRDGFNFEGWYTHPIKGEKVTTDTVFTSYSVSSVNVPLYARWTSAIPGTFTITLDVWRESMMLNEIPLDGARISTTTVATDTNGKIVGDLPVPTSYYYDHSGWRTETSWWNANHVFTEDSLIFIEWFPPLPA
ncbi:MAG: InlB B-repeat-containing protein [Oscillospiraceae bacterium]|nr:InlB B-repeat-containing protein [Oscillospiraceae bacterium]